MKNPFLGMSALCPWWQIPILVSPLLKANCPILNPLPFVPPSPCPLPANITFIYTHNINIPASSCFGHSHMITGYIQQGNKYFLKKCV